MILSIFLQSVNGGGQFIVMMLLMGVVFYFFMIRPQQKKQKEEKRFQTNLKKGDKIVTISGIHGKIIDINEEIAVIETISGKIKFERTALSKELSIKRYPGSDNTIGNITLESSNN